MLRYPIKDGRSYDKAKLHNGEIVNGLSRAHLRKMVFKRLAELNELPLNFDSYFADAICNALSPERAAHECRYIDDAAPAVLHAERVLRVDDVWRFITAMKNWLAAGGGLDAAEEAERRAQTCAQCPRNVDVAGCSWCSGVLSASLNLLAGRTTSVDHRLKHCDVCGCSNRAAVHFPLAAADQSLDYPAWCWKRRADLTAPPDGPH